MQNRFADLHVHPHLKDFNHVGYYSEEPKIWRFYDEQIKSLLKLHPMLRHSLKGLAKSSQSNLDFCYAGNVRLIFPALMAIERQQLHLWPQKPFRLLFKLLLPKRIYHAFGAAVSGFPEKKIERIVEKNIYNNADDGVNYFIPFMNELQYMIDQQRSTSDKYPTGKFQIAKNYDEYLTLKEDQDRIIGILSVEGAHNFGDYLRNSTFQKTYDELDAGERKRLDTSIKQNIASIKKHDYAPFFVTFCHHFNNLLAGHSRSLSAKSRFVTAVVLSGILRILHLTGLPYILHLPGIRHLFNQLPNLNNGFSPLGRDAIIQLLRKSSESKRILIDTKHMSIETRREFYELLNINFSEEKIPIIHSHGCISGWATLDDAQQVQETTKLDANTYFSRWRINLTNEDILKIYDSDGIIGLILHEGRAPGGRFHRQARKLKRLIDKLSKKLDKSLDPDKGERRHILWQKLLQTQSELESLYCQLFWSNIFHIVKLIKDERDQDGWKILSLGSDYDGLVDPYDSFADVRSYPLFRSRLKAYYEKGKPIYHVLKKGQIQKIPKEELASLLSGRSVDQRLEEIFFSNIEVFLSKYFTEQYLYAQSPESSMA